MYKSPQKPQIAELSWSGVSNAESYTYSLSIDQKTTNFISINNGTDAQLQSGHYYCIAYPDYTRTAQYNNQIYWFIDGIQTGSVGGSDHFNQESTDNAEATFTLLSGGILTLQQTAWSGTGSVITMTSHCKALIWRIPL